MIRDFEDMKYVCYRNSADLIFVNLPIADFTGHNVIRPQSISKNIKFVSDNNNIDSIYKSIALIVNVPYFELTDKFIKLNDKSSYFFRYDGHPNEKGYNEIGNSIGELLISKFNIKTRISK
jgi:lysophospholipase L1-like esterase